MDCETFVDWEKYNYETGESIETTEDEIDRIRMMQASLALSNEFRKLKEGHQTQRSNNVGLSEKSHRHGLDESKVYIREKVMNSPKVWSKDVLKDHFQDFEKEIDYQSFHHPVTEKKTVYVDSIRDVGFEYFSETSRKVVAAPLFENVETEVPWKGISFGMRNKVISQGKLELHSIPPEILPPKKSELTEEDFRRLLLTGSTVPSTDKILAEMEKYCQFENETIVFMICGGRSKSSLGNCLYQLLSGKNYPSEPSFCWIEDPSTVAYTHTRSFSYGKPEGLILMNTPDLISTSEMNSVIGQWVRGQPTVTSDWWSSIMSIGSVFGSLFVAPQQTGRPPSSACVVIKFDPNIDIHATDSKDLRIAEFLTGCIINADGCEMIPFYIVTGIEKATQKSFSAWKKLATKILKKENWDTGVFYVSTNATNTEIEFDRDNRYALYRVLKCIKDSYIGK